MRFADPSSLSRRRLQGSTRSRRRFALPAPPTETSPRPSPPGPPPPGSRRPGVPPVRRKAPKLAEDRVPALKRAAVGPALGTRDPGVRVPTTAHAREIGRLEATNALQDDFDVLLRHRLLRQPGGFEGFLRGEHNSSWRRPPVGRKSGHRPIPCPHPSPAGGARITPNG